MKVAKTETNFVSLNKFTANERFSDEKVAGFFFFSLFP